MYYYIYKVTNPETGEFYIGRRKSSIEPELDVEYKGSMLNWKVDKSILIKEILIKDINNIEILEDLEIKLITENIKDPLNRNAHIPGKGFCTKGPRSEETKKKLSDYFKGRKNPNYPKTLSDKARKNISDGCKGRIISEETKEKLSIAMSKRKLSEEHKKKIGESWESRTVSKETCKKISDSKKGVSITMTQKRVDADAKRKGKSLSDETKKKMSDAKRNMSDETKQKMRKPKSSEHIAKIQEAKRKKKEEKLKNPLT